MSGTVSRLPLRLKLIVLIGVCAAVSLVISSTITLTTTYIAEREVALRMLHQLADVSSENLRAALAFRDADSAGKLLQPLQANPHIRMALVHDEHEQTLGRYQAAGLTEADQVRYLARIEQARAALRANRMDAFLADLDFDYAYVVHVIEFEDHPIGTLTIVSDTLELRDKLLRHLLFQLALAGLTITLLILTSIPLQRYFTRPIYELLEAMQRIAASRDYRLRLKTEHHDEFRQLFQGFNTMLEEIEERDMKLSQLATTDPLTGLANRRHALETLDAMLTRARRKHEMLGIIMMDIDHFKRVNDTYGHATGDRVLKEVARITSACARDYDLVARVGGEEFLILCDSSDLAASTVIGERIRSSIEQQPIRCNGVDMHITVSLGVCACIPDAISGTEMMAYADAALYRAKRAGRNRIEVETIT